MIYFSLVGTQVMSILNPLLALKENNQMPDRIVLAHTPFHKSKENAETIRNFLVSDGYLPDQIRLIQISNSLEINENADQPAQSVFKQTLESKERVGFNLAGGLNFQIAACLAVMNPSEWDQCEYIYPEFVGIHLVKIKHGAIAGHDLLPLPKPLDVMALQKIPFKEIGGEIPDFLDTALKNIPYIKNICIGNVTFDAVINDGNDLKFFKVIQPSKKQLEEVRSVMSIRREAFGELYHRQLIVLTNNPEVEERIRAESGGKTEVFRYDTPMFRQLMTLRLTGNFSGAAPANLPLPKHSHVIEQSITSCLYVSLGQNIMPTLIAVWSHKPDKVCFIYTPDDPEIIKYGKAILKNQKNLPVKAIQFYPASILGTEILKLPPQTEKSVHVNITPGTKGHTAFLTLWASKVGASVFSIHTHDQKLHQIPSGSVIDAKAPSPVDYFKINGVTIKTYGENKGSILQEKEGLHALVRVIRRIADAGNLNNFPYKHNNETNKFSLYPIQCGDISIQPAGKEMITIRFKDENPVQCGIDRNGIWFERLIGYVMADCGANDVQIRIRTGWSPKTTQKIKTKIKEKSEKSAANPHMSDIDVAARFKTIYYVISCKATGRSDSGRLTTEANAYASLFGRFAVPLMCFMKYAEDPLEVNGVYIFGWKTFTDTAAMKDLLKRAVSERRH